MTQFYLINFLCKFKVYLTVADLLRFYVRRIYMFYVMIILFFHFLSTYKEAQNYEFKCDFHEMFIYIKCLKNQLIN